MARGSKIIGIHQPEWTLDQELDFVVSLLGMENDLIVTSPSGVILRISELYEEHYGLKKNSIVGRSIYDLEREGIFRPSITVIVLREKRKVTLVHEIKGTGKILSTGIPVFDEHKKLKYVASFSSVSSYDTKTPGERFEKLLNIVNKYNLEVREKHLKNMKITDVIFHSKRMAQIYETILQIADTNANVVLTGETGVGKSMIAHVIHKSSQRTSGPFIEINCGAIPETLIESELFGYVGGAFTGADIKGKKGKIQAAEGGTLFLDEIGEMPLNMQLKLLHVLQEKKVVPVGGNQPVSVDFRLIAATNRDLQQDVEQGRFRIDLYYRIHVVPIHVPALRERPEDIYPLAMSFLDKFNKKYQKKVGLSEDLVERLCSYEWPGNIRQLENELERIVILSQDGVISSANMSEKIIYKVKPRSEDLLLDEGRPYQELMEEYERKIFTMAYQREKTSVAVAKALGIGQTTAARKLRKYVPEYSV